jgi:menaquinone-dependent protoporphyrinogen oxidase
VVTKVTMDGARWPLPHLASPVRLGGGVTVSGAERQEVAVRILVAYASRHGATEGIAERIAATLRRPGYEVDLRRAQDVSEVDQYDAYVIGGAAYMGRWLNEATQLVRTHRATLVSRSVWLFSSGPIGPDKVDKQGRDALEATRPREFTELAPEIHPRDMKVFFGAFDPDAPPIGIAERLMAMTPARKALPSGDFRDWEAIDQWAEQIALSLEPALVAG